MLVWVIEGDVGERKGETERRRERQRERDEKHERERTNLLLVLLKTLSMLHSNSHS